MGVAGSRGNGAVFRVATVRRGAVAQGEAAGLRGLLCEDAMAVDTRRFLGGARGLWLPPKNFGSGFI